MNIRQMLINGRRWRLKRAKNLGNKGDEVVWGQFDPNKNIIRIQSSVKEEALLDTEIHEFVHAFFDSGKQPLLHEDTVKQFSTDLAMYLWRRGYRNPESEDWGEDKI